MNVISGLSHHGLERIAVSDTRRYLWTEQGVALMPAAGRAQPRVRLRARSRTYGTVSLAGQKHSLQHTIDMGEGKITSHSRVQGCGGGPPCDNTVTIGTHPPFVRLGT